MSESASRAADRLAYEVARLVAMGTIDARSAASDALLAYLGVGSVGGPQSVPEWVAKYEKKKGGES